MLPPVFGEGFRAAVRATVDGSWPEVDAVPVDVGAERAGRAEIPIRVDGATPPGLYTFAVRVFEGDRLRSVLKQPLHVSELLDVALRAVPKTLRADPAIAVTIRSLAEVPMQGTVRLRNRSPAASSSRRSSGKL